MATVVQNDTPATTSSNGMGFFLGMLLLIVALVLFFLYGLPALTQNTSGTSVSLPNRVNVNVPNAK